MTTFGIDVSHWQGPLDWPAVRDDGIDFAVVRASLGRQVDKTFASKFRAARKAGLVVGAYHYLWPGVDTAASVRLFRDTVGPLDDVLVVLDVEKRPKGINDRGVHRATRDWVNEFHDQAGDHPVVIYTGRWFWKGVIGSPDGSSLGQLWHSEYVHVDNPKEPTPYQTLFGRVKPRFWQQSYGGWERARILQFTSSGKVRGYPGRLDVNAFKGSLEELQALAAPDGSGQGDTPMTFYVRRDESGTFTIPPNREVHAYRLNAAGTAWEVDKVRPAAAERSREVRFDFRVGRTIGTMRPSSLVHVIADDPFFDDLYIDTAEVDEVFDETPAKVEAAAAARQLVESDDCFQAGAERGAREERERLVQAIFDQLSPADQARFRTEFDLPDAVPG